MHSFGAFRFRQPTIFVGAVGGNAGADEIGATGVAGTSTGDEDSIVGFTTGGGDGVEMLAEVIVSGGGIEMLLFGDITFFFLPALEDKA